MKVTEDDEAAAMRFISMYDSDFPELSGMFAAHRQSAERRALERAAEKAASIGEQYGEDETGWFECSETIAQAIRALGDE